MKYVRNEFTHGELVDRGAKWLRNNGCGFVLKELTSSTTETPDVIGWCSGASILIEVKTNRADFFNDVRKSFRRRVENGMGNYRLYLTPVGLVTVDELPPGWGLIYARGKTIQRVLAPLGNVWSGHYGRDHYFKANLKAERAIMFSALRRVELRGDLNKIYDRSTIQ